MAFVFLAEPVTICTTYKGGLSHGIVFAKGGKILFHPKITFLCQK